MKVYTIQYQLKSLMQRRTATRQKSEDFSVTTLLRGTPEDSTIFERSPDVQNEGERGEGRLRVQEEVGEEGVQGLHFDELDDSDDRKKAEALLLPAHDVSLIVDQTSLQTPGVDLRGDVVKKGARAQVSRASRLNGELEGRKSSCARIGLAVWGVFWDPPKMVSTKDFELTAHARAKG